MIAVQEMVTFTETDKYLEAHVHCAPLSRAPRRPKTTYNLRCHGHRCTLHFPSGKSDSEGGLLTLRQVATEARFRGRHWTDTGCARISSLHQASRSAYQPQFVVSSNLPAPIATCIATVLEVTYRHRVWTCLPSIRSNHCRATVSYTHLTLPTKRIV